MTDAYSAAALAASASKSAFGSFLGKFIGNVGSVVSGALSYAQQMNMMQKQYEYNLALQQQSQAWQTEMSNTAHQRQVKDLRSAGLNPILSANSGAVAGSAGTNSVAQPSGDPVGTAMAYKALRSQTKLNDSQEELNNANSAKSNKEGFAAELNAKMNEKYLNNKIKNENAMTKAQTYSLIKNANTNASASPWRFFIDKATNKNSAKSFNEKISPWISTLKTSYR